MDLSKLSTQELRAELHARDERERQEEWRALADQHPCPECGAGPVSFETDTVEEYRFAPRDDEGRPMLYAPYEMGTTGGVRYETVVTCANGHKTSASQIKWFDKPVEGPPLLPH